MYNCFFFSSDQQDQPKKESVVCAGGLKRLVPDACTVQEGWVKDEDSDSHKPILKLQLGGDSKVW
ncbi:predicted protein [Sclerotinia sclerotiorum 1980 UF-70]|uniref:Uncharacterized protein n=1 Tax=Sclerotinia sclerotiorum (strain ATCC 18683 / 1980 / Ss-1) TaxID=665079 RepID=A7EAZ5_SCLS1|nr:predicted protein [Sclerotinia sclerotiorum 1980 UF-70]EDN99623.1 predicted protein [Sclerotinia sclerotiorum 1980 UF-70]